MWKKVLDEYDENDPQMESKLEKIWQESIKNYEEFGDA